LTALTAHGFIVRSGENRAQWRNLLFVLSLPFLLSSRRDPLLSLLFFRQPQPTGCPILFGFIEKGGM
jgi:hypothetical protein